MTDLTPEQRPDKNGNIVTRWVRRSLKKQETASGIPKVSLQPAPQVTKREVKAVYARLMEALPQGNDSILIAPNDADEDTLCQYDNRNILHGVWRFRAYEVIPLLDAYGEKFNYRTIFDAAEMLTDNDKGHMVPSLTGEQIAAFRSLEKTISDVKYDTEATVGEMTALPLHVLMHPEDGPILEIAIRQGAYDDEKALEMLAEIKAGNLSPAIGDGYL